MMQSESAKFSSELQLQGFTDHDRKVILAILEGQGQYNQEDIIDWSDHNQKMLKKLGVYRKVKIAAKKSQIKLC